MVIKRREMIYAISTGQGVEGNAKEEERGSLHLYSSQGDKSFHMGN